jgi:NTP pyrophosphatase (non-canonical NTP hydrolase)
MEMKELLEFIDWTLSQAGKWTFYHDADITKRILAQSVKLSEEVGELSSEILWHTGFIRAEKKARYTPETLQHEFADVILTTIRLAKLMEVDIETALKNKMDKIKQRAVDIQ